MIETLFFFAYYAYLNGDIEKTRMYFDMLRKEFNEKKDIHSLEEYQYKELKNIRQALNTGAIPKCEWINESSAPSIKYEGIPDLKQDAIVKRIHFDALDELRKTLGSDESLRLYNIEHPCNPHGRVDMVYRDSITAYPVEVKRQHGRHDLLGQIAKYTLYFRTLLHLKHFKKVQPVTICRCYDQHTLAELKRMSVITLRYTFRNDKLSLSLV
jgi:hypothetical protein